MSNFIITRLFSEDEVDQILDHVWAQYPLVEWPEKGKITKAQRLVYTQKRIKQELDSHENLITKAQEKWFQEEDEKEQNKWQDFIKLYLNDYEWLEQINEIIKDIKLKPSYILANQTAKKLELVSRSKEKIKF